MAHTEAVRVGRDALYTTISEAPEECVLPLEGSLPSWLNGTLYRNGPGSFEYGDVPLLHLFDGSALLQKFELRGSDGSVRHSSRFLRSRTYEEGVTARRPTRREFGTDCGDSLLKQIHRILTATDDAFTDNASVTIVRMASRLLALTETSVGYEIDATSLETRCRFDAYATRNVGDIVRITTGHPTRIPGTRNMVNVATRINPVFGHSYEVVITPEEMEDSGTFKDDCVASPRHAARHVRAFSSRFLVPTPSPTYMHSFATTQDYIILTECPVRFSLAGAAYVMMYGSTITDIFPWDPSPSATTTFKVISLREQRQVASMVAPPFFVFHHINAYQEGDRIVVDLCAYEDTHVIQQLYLNQLRDGSTKVEGGRWRRFELNLTTQRCVEATPATPAAASVRFELPRMNEARTGLPYRFFYASQITGGTDFGAICKVDAHTGVVQQWESSGVSVGEPVFIARPDATEEEDDGVLVSLCLDYERGKSFVSILDARTMQEHARAYLPRAQPVTFHGNFLTASEVLALS